MAAFDATSLVRVQDALLAWYAANGRDLPWRHTRDPYAILVAEVMLQQTQVDRVIPLWQAWLVRFPTIGALASAPRSEAIRQWQGLGYNLRAVRLHALACQVVEQYGGVLPRSLEGLMGLKGVGRYTAGAVACFAYEQPVAMVDTNVRRVLGRVFGLEPGAVSAVADLAVPRSAAYPWNQALMDLGATLCRVTQPLCLVCPLLADCAGPRAARAPTRTAAAFAGSNRYYRGRLVDNLRQLSAGSSVGIIELAARVAPAADRDRVVELIRRLAADGLLSLDAFERVRLPE